MNARVWRVGELTRRVKELLEVEIDQVWVQGEISSWKVHGASGHAYFCLKDDRAVLNCVAWAATVRAVSRTMRPRDGLEIRAFGRLTVYEPRGAYQLVVEQMLDEGEGALQAAFLRMKRKLEGEGLFDPERKRLLPACPARIGIATSASGAALRDMLRILSRRWPAAEVVLRPAAVQGPGAASDLAAALADLNALPGIDVILLGRGGGSLEDLWAFNEESLARAVAASRVPVISAVGHEVDFTICDFVADARAATPTHAAEMAVPDRQEVRRRIARDRRILRGSLGRALQTAGLRLARIRSGRALQRPEDLLRRGRLDLDRLEDRLREGLAVRMREDRRRLGELGARLHRGDPSFLLARSRHRLETCGSGLGHAVEVRLSGLRARQELAGARLEALGPARVLERGYAIVTGPEGKILRAAGSVRPGDPVRVRLHAGRLGCTVDAVEIETTGEEEV